MSEMNKELSYLFLYGKFLPWLGLWFLMDLTHFDLRRDFLYTKTIDVLEGNQMQIGEYMSRTRIEDITSALKYTDKPP